MTDLKADIEQRMLKILGEEIRLVARQEYNCETCGEPTVWMVKPGTLERAVSCIVVSIEAGAELAAKKVALEILAEKDAEIARLRSRLAGLEEYSDTYGPGVEVVP